jgi:hypothetical protein
VKKLSEPVKLARRRMMEARKQLDAASAKVPGVLRFLENDFSDEEKAAIAAYRQALREWERLRDSYERVKYAERAYV